MIHHAGSHVGVTWARSLSQLGGTHLAGTLVNLNVNTLWASRGGEMKGEMHNEHVRVIMVRGTYYQVHLALKLTCSN